MVPLTFQRLHSGFPKTLVHIVDGQNLKVHCVATEFVQQRVLLFDSGNTVRATGVGFHVFSLNSHSELRQHDLVEGKTRPNPQL